jgi:hypothetical protein
MSWSLIRYYSIRKERCEGGAQHLTRVVPLYGSESFRRRTLQCSNCLNATTALFFAPIVSRLMFFMQQLGGSVFLSVAQNIFSSKLVGRLSGVAGLDPKAIVNTGATDLRNIVPLNELSTVLDAYSYALARVFVLTTALGACMILGALAVEWKSIKAKNGPDDPSKTAVAKLEEGQSEPKGQIVSGTDRQ